jgi:AraC family transcriptional regulator, alkane utilization regulator
MDLLTNVLETVHLRSVLLYRGRVRGAFGVAFSPREDGAEASFHVVTAGRCLLTVAETGETAWLNAGDFVLLPHAHDHDLRDAPTTPVRYLDGERPPGAVDLPTGETHFGGVGPETAIVCGKFYFRNRETNPLLRSLPNVLVVRGEQGRSVPWLEFTLSALGCESQNARPGAPTVISRLADILFIQALRAYLSEISARDKGWLRVMGDEQIGPALAAVHNNPAHPWTVEGLARVACLSRSAFSARFTLLMGEAPLQYVTRWRVHLAAGLLRDTALPLAEIATRVGYGSEAAFNKVFKRVTGTTPGRYRAGATGRQ